MTKKLHETSTVISGGSAETSTKPVVDEELKKDPEYIKVQRLARTIFSMCDLAGFHVEGRITLKGKKSGRIWN